MDSYRMLGQGSDSISFTNKGLRLEKLRLDPSPKDHAEVKDCFTRLEEQQL